MKPALLVIDMQKDCYRGDSKAFMDSAGVEINYILPHFRKNNFPVIWIQDIEYSSGRVPGKEGFEIIESLIPAEGEYRVHKQYMNSFNKTELADIIRKENADTLVISGFCAEYCVLSTYRGALDLDFYPVILKNGIAAGKKENIRFVEDLCELITPETLTRLTGN